MKVLHDVMVGTVGLYLFVETPCQNPYHDGYGDEERDSLPDHDQCALDIFEDMIEAISDERFYCEVSRCLCARCNGLQTHFFLSAEQRNRPRTHQTICPDCNDNNHPDRTDAVTVSYPPNPIVGTREDRVNIDGPDMDNECHHEWGPDDICIHCGREDMN